MIIPIGILPLLALAISYGSLDHVTKYLGYVDNINSEDIAVPGWRQRYTMAHVALDPKYFYSKESTSVENDLINRKKIVHLLGPKGADFNKILDNYQLFGRYHNPPLTCGELRGECSEIIRERENHLRAVAILYGAKPELSGSSYVAFDSDLDTNDLCGKYILTENSVYLLTYKEFRLLTDLQKLRYVKLADKSKERFGQLADALEEAPSTFSIITPWDEV